MPNSSASIDIKLTGGNQFKELSKKLKDPVRKDLRENLLKQIRTAARPLVDDARVRVLAIQSHTDASGHAGINSGVVARTAHAGSRGGAARDHGLRATIARAIQLKVRTTGNTPGVSIRVDTTKLPADQRKLPRALDSAKGWRHPVFGHDTWVTQHGQPWWTPTFEHRADEVRARIIVAMRETAAKVKE